MFPPLGAHIPELLGANFVVCINSPKERLEQLARTGTPVFLMSLTQCQSLKTVFRERFLTLKSGIFNLLRGRRIKVLSLDMSEQQTE